MIGYIIIAILAVGAGFVIGLRSKAQAKIKKRNATRYRNVYIKENTQKSRKAPPPPPPPRII